MDSFIIRGAPFFAVAGCSVLVSKFTSLTFKRITSIGLSPVSIEIFSRNARCFPACEISIFSFAVVGIFGILEGCLYNGIFHVCFVVV